MNFFFEVGDNYAKESTWKDFALVKFCLFSMGIMCGMNVKKKWRIPTFLLAAGVFGATYAKLMKKLYIIVKKTL